MGDDPAKPKKGFAERGAACLSWQLRLLSVLQLLAGAGYLALAVFLQFPPGDPLTLGMWAIGVLTILTSIFGLAGGCCRARCCLGVYIVLAVLATAAQAGFVLYLFIDPSHAEQQVAKYQRARSSGVKDNLHAIIYYGRWGLLGLLGVQALAIAVAAILRCCARNRKYEEFKEEEEEDAYEARRAAAAQQLEGLKSKLGLVAAEEGAAGSKRVINITAVSGSAAERMRAQSWQQQQQEQQQTAMRSVLFQRSGSEVDDAKLESEMEAGKISSRVATDAEASNPWEAQPASSSTSAWTQPPTAPPQRPFKPSWSKASRQHQQ